MLPVAQNLRSLSSNSTFFIFLDATLALHCVCYVTQGLKTGMYYLRTKPAAQAIQFTVDKKKLKASKRESIDEIVSFLTKPLSVRIRFSRPIADQPQHVLYCIDSSTCV